MRTIYLSALTLSILATPVAVEAQSAGAQKRVFQCTLGVKSLSVASVGGNLVYNYGTSEKIELSIIGNRINKNVYRAGNFGTLDYYQTLRFTNGRYSYLISEEGSTEQFNSGRHGKVTLTVSRDAIRISQQRCLRGGFENIDLLDEYPDDPIDN